MKLGHVVETLLTIPWAIDPKWADRMLAIARRDGDPDALAAELGEPLNNTRDVTVRDGIATIPITGPMFRYANLFTEVSGATSYDAVALDFGTAVNDPAVEAIILSIDSPGGEAFGAAELSDMIYNARAEKPIIAYVGGYGASAAYWIASAASEVVTASTALLGSIGTVMSVYKEGDGADEAGGREIQFISSQSPNKHLDPTSAEGETQNQTIVDEMTDVFAGDVARNRGVSVKTVLADFGQGGVFVGGQAVMAGLADRVATLEVTHQALAAKLNSGSLPFTRRVSARTANTAYTLEQLLQAAGLDNAVRHVAAQTSTPVPTLTVDATGPGGTDNQGVVLNITPTETREPEPPALPEPTAGAVIPEDKTMEENELVVFKARLAEVQTLCAMAGCPEKAIPLAEGDKSIEDIRAEMLIHKTTATPAPEPVVVPVSGVVHSMTDRAADRPFATFGEQLVAIAAYGDGNGPALDPRQVRIQAAVSGAGAGTGVDGGFAVQKDFQVDLMKESFESGALASRCSQTEVGAGSDGLKVVTIDETSRATGSRWGGVQIYRRDEAGSATVANPTLKIWEVQLEDLIGAAYMTERLLTDAPAMQAVFQEAFREEFGFIVDNEIFRGTGAGQCLGILNAGCTTSVAAETNQTASTIVAENISAMWAAILPRAKANGAWFINTEVTPQLDAMGYSIGTAGQLVYMPPGGLSGSPYGTLKGRPVIEIEHAEEIGTVGDITFLDLSYYKLITKGGIQADDSIHVRFLNHERTFRWIARVNGAPKLTSAITPFQGGTSLSPFVTLAAR